MGLAVELGAPTGRGQLEPSAMVYKPGMRFQQPLVEWPKNERGTKWLRETHQERKKEVQPPNFQ